MPNYKNLYPTVLESDNTKRLGVNEILTDVQLNGERTKLPMRLKLVGSNGDRVGEEIEFGPEELISGL